MPWPSLLPVLLLTLATCVSAEPQQQSQHNSNFAVLVSTSRSWRNYRHTANVLAIYRTVKRLGIPDSNILLFMADDHACNPRNPWKANIFRSEDHSLNVYGNDVEVDYRGYEVTIENLLRVLTGRHDPAVPKSKRLLSDQGSNILIFMTGHGGDEFLKFQDVGELLAQDLADALDQMAEKGRYNEVLLIVETCEAHSLTNRITAPRVVTMASSLKGESSYSYRNDFALGQSMTDRFTHQTLEFMERVELSSDASLQDLINSYRYSTMQSHLGTRVLPGINRPLSEVKLTDFFGGVSPAHLLPQTYPLGPRKTEQQQQQQQWQQQRRDAERSAPSLQQQQQVQQQVLHQPSKMDQGSGAQQDWLMVAVGMTLVAAVSASSWLTGRRQE